MPSLEEKEKYADEIKTAVQPKRNENKMEDSKLAAQDEKAAAAARARELERERAVATPTDFAFDFGKGLRQTNSFDASNGEYMCAESLKMCLLCLVKVSYHRFPLVFACL